MVRLTKPQQLALKALYDRSHTPSLTYWRFRHQVICPLVRGESYVLVPWCGMMVGIESDGHTHS